ncbi:polysaccharide deacetylase family protein [Acetanaerobacterium elongatum]|uniref:Polysaccharide deacetylase n=1 Tax=Acetanaerobacterium elongatum TaxID=258515 RepID=A0A1H0CVP5_9FIRM|nr:polysaccharide deacetylase family protein [Acetanaerobacterium elongatum]SDN61959.1 Polysaccharide deacetylase [Acetanaerobacterium elongatum]
MSWQACYPMGRKAAVTLSYDDGQVYDRRLVEILNRYGLKATFHLNSGTLDREGFITSKEVAALYAGHEVACHGVQHLYFTHLSREQLVSELWEDRRRLEELTNSPVTGLSYPFGVYSDDVVAVVKSLGFEYARTVESTGGFQAEPDFLRWKPTCHHKNELLNHEKHLLAPFEYERLQLFYIWGHSYEFERDGNWSLMEEFCSQIGSHDEVWYATNIEVKRYLSAVRSLVSTTDVLTVYNPSGQNVWIKSGGVLHKVLPGEILHL